LKVAQNRLGAVVGASMIGTMIEWFDFFIYGFASALVFNKLFFPSFSPLTGTLLAFSTYALGFVARPLGGVIFGHFGDRVGRKKLLMISLMVMGLSTVGIGLLPTFEQVGVLAPILLIALRLAQGFAVGGEWGGAVLMVAETAPPARRGFWTCWPQVGAPAGNLLAAGVFAVAAASLSEADFLSWGWRIPFLSSIVLVGVGYWLRRAVAESHLFESEATTVGVERFPVMEVVRRNPRALLEGAGLRFGENLAYYVAATFSITYFTQIRGGSKELVLDAVILGSALECLTMPLFAALSDKLGRRPVYLFGALSMGLSFLWFFGLLDSGSEGEVTLAIAGAMIAHGAMYAPQGAFIAELFPTRLRYSGASVAYQASSVLAGSLAPMVSLALYQAWNSSAPVVAYVMAGCLVSALAALVAPETRGIALDAAGAPRA